MLLNLQCEKYACLLDIWSRTSPHFSSSSTDKERMMKQQIGKDQLLALEGNTRENRTLGGENECVKHILKKIKKV